MRSNSILVLATVLSGALNLPGHAVEWKVMAAGQNPHGQLGNGMTGYSVTTPPVAIPNLTGVVAIAVGSYHSLALLNDGTVQAWGSNGGGQLGTGTNTSSPTPVSVSGLSDVVAIAAGDVHSLALLSDGTVKAWGVNDFGQLGNGTDTNAINLSRISPFLQAFT